MGSQSYIGLATHHKAIELCQVDGLSLCFRPSQSAWDDCDNSSFHSFEHPVPQEDLEVIKNMELNGP